MLVLTRRIGEQIYIGDDIILTVVRIQGDKVRLGIEAPRTVSVHREELRQRLKAAAAQSEVDPAVTEPIDPNSHALN